jgi:hypothetical protein
MIGGSGRSGTTILRKLFGLHPDIAAIPEWRFLTDPDGLLDFYNTFQTTWSPYHFDMKLKRMHRMLKHIGKDKYFGAAAIYGLRKLNIQNLFPFRIAPTYSEVMFVKKYCPNYSRFVEKLVDQLKLFTYKGEWFGNRFLQKRCIDYNCFSSTEEIANPIREFYLNIIDDVLAHQRKKYFLDKNTWNILWFDKILELFPESRLIHIYRDPRDVIASFVKQSWSPSDPVQAARFYHDIMDTWQRIKIELPEDTYCEISLEELVADKEKTIKKLCGFMQVEWNSTLLDMDLSGSNTGRWKKEFTREQQEAVNSVIEQHIDQLGYTK